MAGAPAQTFSAASVLGQNRYLILLSERPVLWAFDEGRSARPKSIVIAAAAAHKAGRGHAGLPEKHDPPAMRKRLA